ncbi:TonB-dependent siderophore receptor [Methylosinus sp. RM1]|uniref:TonB-dependent receptor n=1 Tax=Methylosinus sp. RM1 TaxID=2583817 RepID=UPI001FEDFBE1|nr:TonB-dependent receptor [Methylosinus sp. RM1]
MSSDELRSRVVRNIVIIITQTMFVGSVMAEQDSGDRATADRREQLRGSPGSEKSVHARDLGKDTAGVFINGPSSDSGYSPNFVMRGFPNGLALFDGTSHGFTSQEVDLSTVDHVEFYKGPSSMLYGKAVGGYGGVANYITKAPTEEAFTAGNISVGSFGLRRLTLDGNAPLNNDKKLLLRVTGSVQSTDSFVDFVRSRGFDIAPKVAFTDERGDRWSLRAEHNASRLVYRDGVPADPSFFHVPREFYGGVPANENETPFYDDIAASFEHSFNEHWRGRVNLDYYLRSTRYGWFLGWGYDGSRSLTLGQPARTHYSIRSFAAQVGLDGDFWTGSWRHSVSVGAEHWDYFYAYDHKIGREALAPIDIFRPIYPVAVNYDGAYWANGVARAWSQSVFGQDMIDFDDHWRLMVGGRYDLLSQRERMFDPFGVLAGEPTIGLSKGINGYFSPRGGILYRPWSSTHLFVAFGQSLIPNTGVRLRGGDAPAPQRDTQYELGLKQGFPDHNLVFGIGLFDVTRDHVAIVDPANPSGFYSIVTGQQHSHGVELNASAELIPNLRIEGAATFVHAVVSKDSNSRSQLGSDLLGAPRRVYSVSANYDFDFGPFAGLAIGASYYYASRAQATLPNAYGFTVASQRMLGASLSCRVNDKMKLEVNASNLMDRANFTSNGALFRGEPRSISLGLQFRY